MPILAQPVPYQLDLMIIILTFQSTLLQTAITGFTEGATISITGMLEDYADGAGGTGNQTVGSPSSVTLEVDQTDPASLQLHQLQL